VWLQSAGYYTALAGKFLNAFLTPLNPKFRCPLGWNAFDVLTNGTYNYWASTWSLDCGTTSRPMSGQYQTDVLRDKALKYIE
jgi:N-acetylglucosamine-6-sulfatase